MRWHDLEDNHMTSMILMPVTHVEIDVRIDCNVILFRSVKHKKEKGETVNTFTATVNQAHSRYVLTRLETTHLATTALLHLLRYGAMSAFMDCISFSPVLQKISSLKQFEAVEVSIWRHVLGTQPQIMLVMSPLISHEFPKFRLYGGVPLLSWGYP